MTDCGETALMHEWCMAQVWCIRCTDTWIVLEQSNVCNLCVTEKKDKSAIYTIRSTSRVFSLIFEIQFLHGSGAGDLEQRCLQWRVP